MASDAREPIVYLSRDVATLMKVARILRRRVANLVRRIDSMQRSGAMVAFAASSCAQTGQLLHGFCSNGDLAVLVWFVQFLGMSLKDGES